MTRDRIYGEDTEFSAWLRKQERIPSSVVSVSDCDYVIHRYKQPVDGLGTRDLQAMMILEVKTRNGEPRFAQLDSMYLQHEFSKGQMRKKSTTVVHHGVSFLSLSGTTPDNSSRMRLGRFGEEKAINWRPVDGQTLESLLLFNLHPDSLTPNPYRRHHKTNTFQEMMSFPLGFSAPVTIITRS